MVIPQPNSVSSVPANGFGIYLHTPFCTHKCSYCDFYSFAGYAPSDFRRVADGLIAEARAAAAWWRETWGEPRPVGSIFFGGGTPSLIPLPLLAEIFAAVGDAFPLAKGAEITLEANPETVTASLLEGLRSLTPVNRVSLGAQSFQAENLKKLERLGSRESIHAAAALMKKHGYANFNLDLIFAIPGQDMAAVLADLDEAIALGPEHLSFYNLTLKPAHVLHGALPDDDFAADLYEAGRTRLEGAGYPQYEISNFARAGRPSRHNLLYWNGGDFLGFGPSAASRIFVDGKFRHRKQLSDVKRWYELAARFPEPGWETTTWNQTVLEATFLELRRNEGVDRADFARRYSHELASSPKYPLFLSEGLLEETAGRLRLTDRGRLLADSVTRDLAP